MKRLQLLEYVFSFLLLLPLTGAVRIIVEKCPVNEMEWKARSDKFKCKSPQLFHCIQDDNKKLMETCMDAYTVTPSDESGCPWAFYREDIGKSFLGVGFHPCKKLGCPQRNDPQYSTSELYKYPACLLIDLQTISEVVNITEPTTSLNIHTVNRNSSSSGIVTALVISLVTLVIVIGALIVWRRRKSHETKPDLENLMEPMIPRGGDTLVQTLLTKYKAASSCVFRLSFNKDDQRSHQMYTPDIRELRNNNPTGRLTLDDLFYKNDPNATGNRRIFMRGAPGTGKTACCSKLLSDWCEAKEKEGSSFPTDKKGINFFDLIFYVPMHLLSKKCENVQDMICATLRGDLEMEIENVLRNYNTKCLILLDGIDEWQNTDILPVTEGLEECTLFITSRSYKMEELFSRCGPTDRILEIHGVNPPRVIQSVLTSILKTDCSKEVLEAKVKRYTKKVKDPQIESLMTLPAMLIMSCYLWNKEDQELYINKTTDQKGRMDRAKVRSFTQHLLSVTEIIIQQAIVEDLHLNHDRNAVDNDESFSKSLKQILSNFQNISKYMNILWPLCEFAYSALIQKLPLMFSMTELKNFKISDTVVELALKIGIIRQPTTLGDEGNNRSVIFYHKVFQELMAALFILQKYRERVTSFCKECSSLDKVKEMHNVILFLSGLDPTIAGILSRHVVNLMDKCPGVESWRQTLNEEHNSIVKEMSRLQSEWYREVFSANIILNSTNSSLGFCVSDIYLRQKCRVDQLMVAQVVVKENVNTVKSVYLNRLLISENLPERAKLLTLVEVTINDRLSVVKYLYQHSKSLTSLNISAGDIKERKYLVDVLPSLTELQCFQYEGENIEIDVKVVRALTTLKQLKTLKLKRISLEVDAKTMNFSHMAVLQELVLDNVEMSSESWEKCIHSLRNKHMHVVLEGIEDSKIDKNFIRIAFPLCKEHQNPYKQVSFELN